MENAAELQTPSASPLLTETETELLARTENLADTLLEPNAEAVDRSGEPPLENLRALAEAGLAGVTTPTQWGGQGTSGHFLRAYTETLTAACGTTWFVLTQHLGTCASFANSENPSLRERYLRDMATGRHWVGVAFGHLRRPEPMLRAEPVEGGWKLNGVAPWVTGWPLLAGVMYGAVLPDGRHLYVYASADQPAAVQSVSRPLPLCAMNASATTEVRLRDLFVPTEDFVRYSSPEELRRGDRNGAAGASSPALGCTKGSLRLLRRLAERRPHLTAIGRAAEALETEWNACRTNAYNRADGPKDTEEYYPGALQARAWAIELAGRAALMAVTASSGAANALDHPAQRRWREAMFYALIAQTGDTMAATLERLASARPVPQQAS